MRKKRELVMGAYLGPDFISLFDPKNGEMGQTFFRDASRKRHRWVGMNIAADMFFEKRGRSHGRGGSQQRGDKAA
jgi:hypothetical protein